MARNYLNNLMYVNLFILVFRHLYKRKKMGKIIYKCIQYTVYCIFIYRIYKYV